MKKVLMLFILTFFVTGCSVEKLENNSIDDLISDMINNNLSLSNRVGIGYNYYLPNGVTLSEVNDNNEVLYAGGNKYYLYVDLISYQKQVKINYETDSSLYLSKTIKNGKKYGYIEITDKGDHYFIEMMYNYAKIETYAYEYQLEDTIINISYILSSVTYNDAIIKSLVENKVISETGKRYNIFKPKTTGDNYIENVDENLIDTSSTIDDPDVITVNPND